MSFRDLPLVDLPQHALQLANWLRLDAHDPAVSDLELNFRTPYLLGYPVARALAGFLPILTALKLTFWASIALQALTLRKLCERLGHDPWLGLLGFPLGLGYSFCFGFVAFCAALPLVYLGFLHAVTHRAAPSVGRGLALGLTLALLLVAHGVALGFLLAVLGPLLLWGGGKLWQRLLPLLSAPLLGVLWLAPGGTSTRLGGDYWAFEPNGFWKFRRSWWASAPLTVSRRCSAHCYYSPSGLSLGAAPLAAAAFSARRLFFGLLAVPGDVPRRRAARAALLVLLRARGADRLRAAER